MKKMIRVRSLKNTWDARFVETTVSLYKHGCRAMLRPESVMRLAIIEADPLVYLQHIANAPERMVP